MATQITANLPTLNFPREVDYPTQEDWAAFSAAAELNFGILGNGWSTQMQLWKDQANAMSIESNNNADLAQSIANYQGDWVSQGYTLGQSVSISGVYYICKLTHATGQNPTDVGSLYWNIALGNWNLKVNNYGNETIAGIKTFTTSPIVPTPTTNAQAVNKQYTDLKVALADFTGTNVSLVSNGYQKFPSGLIIQWGGAATDENGNAFLTFPLTFPTAARQVVISPTGVYGNIVATWSALTSSVVAVKTRNNGDTINVAAAVSFIVIGY